MARYKRHSTRGILPSAEWVGNRDHAVLIERSRGRVLGGFQHDGYGKYEMTIYVSYWRAWQVLRTDFCGGLLSLRPFPRCALWIFRAKDRSEAIAEIEDWNAEYLTLDG